MRYSYPLFTFNNINFKIHIVFIFLFIFAPIAFYFAFNVITAVAVFVFLTLLGFSIVIHEFSHAYYSNRYKQYVSEIILLPLSGISIRQEMPDDDLDELRIAAVGPIASLSVVLFLAPQIYFFYGFESVMQTTVLEFSPLVILFKINLVLVIVNLIPIYPMDGGRMLRAYFTKRYDFDTATKWATRLTYILVIVVIILGLLFNFLIIILLFLLYGAAHEKERFDKFAVILGAGDSEEKNRILQLYKEDRQAFIDRTDDLQASAEEALSTTPLAVVSRLIFKFEELYQKEVLKGRSKVFRNFLLSILALIFRIQDFGRYWLRTRPILKSVILFIFASASLSLVWLLPTKLIIGPGLTFLLTFAAGAFIIYYHTRSEKIMWYSLIAGASWIVYFVISMMEPYLQLSYWGYLYIEAFRGLLVPVTGILFYAVLLNSNQFFKHAHTYMPLPIFIIVMVLYGIGTGVLFYECYLLSAYESDLDTIRFVLRFDISHLIWFIASALIFASLIYLIYVGGEFRYGHMSNLKILAAAFVMFLLISFFSRDLILITFARYSTDPDDLDMKVGLNAGNITKLDTDEFDSAFHLEVTWQKVYRKGPDEPDWSDTDWQLDYAERKGIDLYFQVHPLPPQWFIDEHEDAIMQDQWGDKFKWVDEDPRSNKTRIWDLSFNDPEVLEAKVNFTEQAVQRYSNKSRIKFIGIQNEPTYPVDFNNLRIASYDIHSEQAFRRWIQVEYNYDLNEFRNDTEVLINEWEYLKPPTSSTHKLWNKWLRFRGDSLIWLVENLTAAVKKHTDKPVTMKIMAHYLARYSTVQSGLTTRVVERFFELSDIVSLDLYPLTNADLQNSLEFYKKLASGKPIIVPEFNMVLGTNTPGSGSWLYYNLVLLNRYVDYVFIFTGDNHFLYGINLYDHSPVHLGLKLYRLHREDGDVYSLYDELLYENFLSIPNYYEMYVLTMAVWGIPVIPWPILLLFLIPIPIADEIKRKKAKKINIMIIIVLLIVFGLVSNLLM